MQCIVTRSCSHRSRHSCKTGIVKSHQIIGIPGCDHRNTKLFHHSKQFLACICQPYTGTCQNKRRFCLFDFLQYFLHQTILNFRCLPHSFLMQIKMSQLLRIHMSALNIQRNVKPYRTLASFHGQIIGFFQMVSNLQRIRHHNRIFCHVRY